LQRVREEYDLKTPEARALLATAVLVPVITAHPPKCAAIHPRPRGGHRRTARPAGRARRPTSDVAEIEAQLKREVRILWQTRMLRSVRINVADEIDNALSVFRTTS